MIATIPLIKRFKSYERVRCYTIKVGSNKPEFIDFLERMQKEMVDISELAEMLQLIENIADKYGILGALDRNCFKGEEKAHRFLMPIESWSKNNSDYGLRLYCVMIIPGILIILNGCLKTTQNVLDCDNCRDHFEFANKVAAAVERDLSKGKISVIDGELYFEDEDYTLYIN